MRLQYTGLDIIAATVIVIAIMIWATAKIIGVNDRIGADELWNYVFMGTGVVGILIILCDALHAVKDSDD